MTNAVGHTVVETDFCGGTVSISTPPVQPPMFEARGMSGPGAKLEQDIGDVLSI